jgi:methylase of polypeptide subunit release factors
MSSVLPSSSEIATVLQALRARLSAADYTPETLKRSLGITYPDDIGLLNHTPALERLRDDSSAAGSLMRLLFLEGAEPERRVAGVLSRELYRELVQCGLLQRSDSGVRAQLRIDAVDDQYFIADRRFRPGTTHALGLPGRDPVYPPSSDSLILREAIVAPDARCVLDLCTGSGVQALRWAHCTGFSDNVVSERARPSTRLRTGFETAPEKTRPPQRERQRTAEEQEPTARPEEPPFPGGVSKGACWDFLGKAHRVRRIVAVDLNPRAAAITRLNAQLNGAANIEVRVGDLYAPVAGEQFDLIVANPPFVASPYASGPAYHSGGRVGDTVLRRIVSGWRTHLASSGRAFAIAHRALRAGEDIEAVAHGWFRNFPGRGLVLILERGTAVDLAAAQALFALRQGLAAYGREVTRWADHLHRLRVCTLAVLLIVAEKRGEQHLEVIEAEPRVLPIPLTPSVTDRVAAWLR